MQVLPPLPPIRVKCYDAATPLLRRAWAFTLVELLVVMTIIILLIGLLTPALTPLKNSQDVTTAAYNLSGVLETARTYAMANHTYVWIGFYEQNYGTTTAPTPTATPPYSGIGHVTFGIVYSKDGTRLVDDTAAGTVALPAAKLGQVGSLTQVYAVHICALPSPPSNSTDPTTLDKLQGRPYQTDLSPAQLEPTLISSVSPDCTSRPFVVQGYTFYKTIRFDPRGEANVNSTDACTRIVELGLRPTHGNAVDSTSSNQVAIQLTGIGGAVTIYRP